MGYSTENDDGLPLNWPQQLKAGGAVEMDVGAPQAPQRSWAAIAAGPRGASTSATHPEEAMRDGTMEMDVEAEPAGPVGVEGGAEGAPRPDAQPVGHGPSSLGEPSISVSGCLSFLFSRVHFVLYLRRFSTPVSSGIIS